MVCFEKRLRLDGNRVQFLVKRGNRGLKVEKQEGYGSFLEKIRFYRIENKSLTVELHKIPRESNIF